MRPEDIKGNYQLHYGFQKIEYLRERHLLRVQVDVNRLGETRRETCVLEEELHVTPEGFARRSCYTDADDADLHFFINGAKDPRLASRPGDRQSSPYWSANTYNTVVDDALKLGGAVPMDETGLPCLPSGADGVLYEWPPTVVDEHGDQISFVKFCNEHVKPNQAFFATLAGMDFCSPQHLYDLYLAWQKKHPAR